jgi:hypothetical protein
MKSLMLEDYNTFARFGDCFPLGAKRDRKKAWLKKNPIYVAELNCASRLMTPVKVRSRSRVYLMDIVTGSLYDRKSKACLSSVYLTLLSYKKDPNNGASAYNIKATAVPE